MLTRPSIVEHDRVECKHGSDECFGNIVELCAADLYPDPDVFLAFTTCMTLDYQRIPEPALIKTCAREHGVNMTKLDHCANLDTGRGMDLLRDSVLRSSDANVTMSCTVSTVAAASASRLWRCLST